MKYIRKNVYIITFVLGVVLLIVMLIVKNQLNEDADNVTLYETVEEKKLINEEKNNECRVDIKGEVTLPGVYSLECTKYVSDAIKLAGGVTENADTSVINLAKKISDEMVIIVYTKVEVNNSKESENIAKIIDCECTCPKVSNDACIDYNDNSVLKTNLININKATIDELKTLPGIGDSKAQSIIEYRNNFGSFKTIEDIKNVNGIGLKLYEQIKDYITT